VIRDRSIAALLAGELVSRLGSQLTYLALPWFVLVTTGSPTRMTLVFAAQLVPMTLLGIPAGSVVHKLGPKTSMLVADGARAPIIALVPFLHEVGGLTFGLILVVAALNGVTRVQPMRMAAIAVVATAAPLWLLVPHSPLWLVAIALAICGASIPMINAPYLGILSTRIPRALRGKVIQSLITINQLAGPAGLLIAGPLFVRYGVHAVYAVVAVLATFASANFILAVVSYPVGPPREPQAAA